MITHQQFFNEMWPLCIKAASATGVHPEIIFAQSALETGYGAHAPQDNYFGIKGSGASLSTTEYINGKAVQLAQHFASANSMADSVAYYTSFILLNPRYRAFRSPGSIAVQLNALGRSGYATDPDYIKKLAPIIDNIPALEKYYHSVSGVVARVTQSPIVMTPAITPAQKQEAPMSDLSKFLQQHASVVNVAADVIKGLLEVAPIPPAAAATVTDVISALQQHATNVGTVAAGMSVSTATSAPVTITTAPVQPQSIQGTLLGDALAEAETLLPQVLGDFENETSLSSGVASAEKTVEVGAINFAQGALTQLQDGLLQPIVKPPTAN